MYCQPPAVVKRDRGRSPGRAPSLGRGSVAAGHGIKDAWIRGWGPCLRFPSRPLRKVTTSHRSCPDVGGNPWGLHTSLPLLRDGEAFVGQDSLEVFWKKLREKKHSRPGLVWLSG